VSVMTEAEKDQFAEQGYICVREAYTEDEVGRLINEYMKVWLEMLADRKIILDPNRPIESLYPRLRDHHLGSESIRKFIMKPAVMERLEELVGERVDLVSTNYYFKGPRTKGMPFHQDNYGIGADPGTCYAVWVSLDYADAVNGGMRMAAGSHKLPLLEPTKHYTSEEDTFGGYVQLLAAPEDCPIVELDTSPGDIVIYHGHLIHDSLDNTTENCFRRSVISHFAGQSVERLLLNYNKLVSRDGIPIRKRPNVSRMKQGGKK